MDTEFSWAIILSLITGSVFYYVGIDAGLLTLVIEILIFIYFKLSYINGILFDIKMLIKYGNNS